MSPLADGEPPCACRARACAGPTPSSRPGQPHGPRAGAAAWAWCPATACCCAAPTRRCWRPAGLAVVKAGGIAVGSMPLLRARELAAIVEKAQISHALCDATPGRRAGAGARRGCPTLQQVLTLRRRAAGTRNRGRPQPATFENVDTAADDICLMAFTSGTTGVPKGTLHSHRDVMAACACWPPHVLRPHVPTMCSSAARRWLSLSAWAAAAVPAGGRREHGAAGEGQRPTRCRRPSPRPTAPPCASPRPRPTAPSRWRRSLSVARGTHSSAYAAQMRLGRRGPAGRHARAVAAGHGPDAHRRHRLHRAAAHLHLRRRGHGASRRHRPAGAGLPRGHPGRSTAKNCRPARWAAWP